jgi:YhcH/YjgK/YiaL family protein
MSYKFIKKVNTITVIFPFRFLILCKHKPGMKKTSFIVALTLLFIVASNQVIAQSGRTSNMNKQSPQQWFASKIWARELKLRPHASINVETFYRQYHLNKDEWDKAFAFLERRDLTNLAPGKYPIDGENVYAIITEGPTKDLQDTKWESHRKYIDLHYVIQGEEKIGVGLVKNATVTEPYDSSKDIAHYRLDGQMYVATPGEFFIFFPADAHRPGITTGGNLPDKKLVIKIRMEP